MSVFPLKAENFELHNVSGVPVLSQRRQVVEDAIAEDAQREDSFTQSAKHNLERAFDRNVSVGAHLYGQRHALDKYADDSAEGEAIYAESRAVLARTMTQDELVAAYENMHKRFNTLWNKMDELTRAANAQQRQVYQHIKAADLAVHKVGFRE